MEPQQQNIPQQPPIQPKPPTPQIKSSLLFILSFLLLITVAISGLFYFQIQKLSKEVSKYQVPASPTPIATIDPTASWKIKKSDIFSFKYPSNLTLEERQENYFVLLSDSKNPSSVFVSIDARMTGDYADYAKAVISTRKNLTEVQTQEMVNGIKISGKMGPGYGQGQQVTMALFKYLESAIEAEITATDSSKLATFNEILSTFEFIEATPSAGPISN